MRIKTKPDLNDSDLTHRRQNTEIFSIEISQDLYFELSHV